MTINRYISEPASLRFHEGRLDAAAWLRRWAFWWRLLNAASLAAAGLVAWWGMGALGWGG